MFGCVTISRRRFDIERSKKTAGSECFSLSGSFRAAGPRISSGLVRKGKLYGDMIGASCSIQIDSGWLSILRNTKKRRADERITRPQRLLCYTSPKNLQGFASPFRAAGGQPVKVDCCVESSGWPHLSLISLVGAPGTDGQHAQKTLRERHHPAAQVQLSSWLFFPVAGLAEHASARRPGSQGRSRSSGVRDAVRARTAHRSSVTSPNRASAARNALREQSIPQLRGISGPHCAANRCTH